MKRKNQLRRKRGLQASDIEALIDFLGPGAHIVKDKVLYVRMVPDFIPVGLRVDFFHKIQGVIDLDLQRLFDLYGVVREATRERKITKTID